MNPSYNCNHYCQDKVDTRIEVDPRLRLPNNKSTKKKMVYDYYQLTAAIQHMGPDAASGHYCVHLLDNDNISFTVDDQCPKGSYIRLGNMDDIERSSIFLYKKIQ